MRLILEVLFLLVVLVVLAGCAGSMVKPIPASIPATVQVTCRLYEQVRPQVVELRTYAIANWEKIPPDVQGLLKELNQVLPELDKAGQVVCAADRLIALGRVDEINGALAKKGVDWDHVLSVVVRTAGTAAEMKARGLF
jgi:biopolymer transport protein ExbD